tara:strand:- start:247 stop:1269 length:1023 start_codon:yes stop_codon:yes gene_type:complete
MNKDPLDSRKEQINSLPWIDNENLRTAFPENNLARLLGQLGWEYSEWIDYWIENNGSNLANTFWPSGTKLDWIWGLALPLLSDIQNNKSSVNSRRLFGISALPGCGKTCLGKWLEASAKIFGISLKVLSLDDFYLPSDELDLAMKDNPWKVPRGIPGSHSIELLESSIDNWLSSGQIEAPQFDKALRNGSGDRSGWINLHADILLIEGWFLGCYPLDLSLDQLKMGPLNSSHLTSDEEDYRSKVQKELHSYLPIWKRIDKLWHIKLIDFASSSYWKVEQETKMLRTRGAALKGESLLSFVRMIQTSIPQHSLMNIDCDVRIEINKEREILRISPENRMER